MKNFNLFLASCFACLIFSCAQKNTPIFDGSEVKEDDSHVAPNEQIQETTSTPQNIILMVGDGMGLTQITSGLIENKSLNLEKINSIGLSRTHSSQELVTDSAAGATAFSIGEKTYNGAIGVDDNKQPKETILETLAKDGYSTGLVATCNITHATPASFYAHQPSRKMYYEIAADMVNTTPDVFVGGGKIHFKNRTDKKQGQPDDRNIIQELENKGVSFVNSFEELENTSGKVGYFFSDDHPKKISEGRGDYLPNSVLPVIHHLEKESEKGFFLMIEGSQIDWGGHANDSEYIISEMIDFDKAVGKVLSYAQQNQNTLVIITADHETGGYALNGIGEGFRDYSKLQGVFTTGGHTGVMVPVFAYGPGEELFRGIYNNNEIYHKIKAALGR